MAFVNTFFGSLVLLHLITSVEAISNRRGISRPDRGFHTYAERRGTALRHEVYKRSGKRSGSVGDAKAVTEDYANAARELLQKMRENRKAAHRSDFKWLDRAPPEKEGSKKMIDESRAAALNEEGYLSVLKLENNDHMEAYIRRLISALGLAVINEGAMDGLVPHFSGVKAGQTFFLLKQELIAIAAQENSWLSEDTNQSAQPSMLMRMPRQDAEDMITVQAPLNQLGYEMAASLGCRANMDQFVRRVLLDMGPFYVADEGRLHGLLKYYNGTDASQNFARMRYELIGGVRDTIPWIASGDSVLLNENGYRAVAALKNDREMGVFIERVADHHGCKVVDKGGLFGVVPYYSGNISVQSLALLETEVREVCGLTNTEIRYGVMHDVVGKGGVLQISLPGSTRYEYSAEELQSAGIVATEFPATNASTANPNTLAESCPIMSDIRTRDVCAVKERQARAPIGSFGATPGCRTKVEQSITDSHRRALLAALEREENWTAIVEDDVVPLHPGSFEDSFKEAWKNVPEESKMVRLGWCTFEQDLGSIRKRTYKNTGSFRLIKSMTWTDQAENAHYYTGGCTTGYLVHKSFIPELLSIFPCCCPIDCCMERQLFYAPAKADGPPTESGLRGEQIMINLDSWDSRDGSFNYTSFIQGGVFVQDNRDLTSLRPEWMSTDPADSSPDSRMI